MRDQVDDSVALVFTAVVAAIGFAVADRIESEWTAAATTVASMAAWFVIASDHDAVVGSALWVAVSTGVAVVLAIRHGWFAERLLAFVVAIIVTVPGLADAADTGAHRWVVIAVAALLGAALLWVPSGGDMTTIWQQLEVQLAIVMPPWLLAVAVTTFDVEGDGAVAAVAFGLAGVVAVAAVLLRPGLHSAHFVALLVGASVVTSIGLAVVLSTAYARYQDDFSSWLADAYVVKSSDLGELKAAVRRCVGAGDEH